MSNLGFFRAMESAGITVEQTRVGDRYVLEAMHANGFILGGEQSGHVVLLKYATTGDGVLTGLHLMSRMAETGRSLADLASVMVRLPQVLVNVPGVDKARADTDPVLAAAVQAASTELGRTGRVLLRPSGTESLVRVMVEAETLDRADEVAQHLADVVRERTHSDSPGRVTGSAPSRLWTCTATRPAAQLPNRASRLVPKISAITRPMTPATTVRTRLNKVAPRAAKNPSLMAAAGDVEERLSGC